MTRPASSAALRVRRLALTGLVTALTVLATALTGCVTSQRILRDRGEGEVRCYLGSFEQVWEAAEEGVRWTGLVTEVADTAQGHLLARNYEPEIQDPERMAVDADAGERVGVFIDSAGAGMWAVEVLSRRVFALDVSARDWTPSVFQAIEARLPESAKADTSEIAECELQRSGSSGNPAAPPGAQPPVGIARSPLTLRQPIRFPHPEIRHDPATRGHAR